MASIRRCRRLPEQVDPFSYGYGGDKEEAEGDETSELWVAFGWQSEKEEDPGGDCGTGAGQTEREDPARSPPRSVVNS